MGDTFYIVGLALTASALVLSFVGLRSERFPDSRGVYAAFLGIMGALVVATCAFAVVLAREEQEHRNEERALEAEEAAAEDEAETAEAEGVEPGVTPPPSDADIEQEPKPAKPLELTSPQDGSLLFEPDSLEGSAGAVAIDYTNPSVVPHNVAIEVDGETVAESATVTDGDAATASAELEPGEYVFYCAIPGHRESGMEGTLTLE